MKRTLIFCLVLAMMMLCTTSVIAEGVTVKTQGFDDLPTGTIDQGNLRSTSTVLDASAVWYEGASIEISENGYNGKCMEITEDGGSKFQFYTAKVNGTDEAPVYINFKLKVIDNLNNTATFKIDLGYNGMVYLQNGTVMVRTPDGPGTWGYLPLVEGEWYDFLYTFKSSRTEVIVTDSNGNSVSGYATGYNFLNIASNNATATSKIAIDEMKMFVLSEGAKVGILQESIPEDLQNMSRLPQFKLSLNQPVKANEVYVDVFDDANMPIDSSKFTVTANGYFEIDVDFSEMLQKGTNYKLIVSNIHTIAGANADDIQIDFKTEYAHMLTLSNKSVEQKTGSFCVNLEFENTKGYKATPVKIMGILYESGKMISIESKDAEIDYEGKLSLEFFTDISGTGKNFDILVFDDSGALIPVNEAINCFN